MRKKRETQDQKIKRLLADVSSTNFSGNMFDIDVNIDKEYFQISSKMAESLIENAKAIKANSEAIHALVGVLNGKPVFDAVLNVDAERNVTVCNTHLNLSTGMDS